MVGSAAGLFGGVALATSGPSVLGAAISTAVTETINILGQSIAVDNTKQFDVAPTQSGQ